MFCFLKLSGELAYWVFLATGTLPVRLGEKTQTWRQSFSSKDPGCSLFSFSVSADERQECPLVRLMTLGTQGQEKAANKSRRLSRQSLQEIYTDTYPQT